MYFTQHCICALQIGLCRCCPESKGCFRTRVHYALYILSPTNR